MVDSWTVASPWEPELVEYWSSANEPSSNSWALATLAEVAGVGLETHQVDQGVAARLLGHLLLGLLQGCGGAATQQVA